MQHKFWTLQTLGPGALAAVVVAGVALSGAHVAAQVEVNGGGATVQQAPAPAPAPAPVTSGGGTISSGGSSGGGASSGGSSGGSNDSGGGRASSGRAGTSRGSARPGSTGSTRSTGSTSRERQRSDGSDTSARGNPTGRAVPRPAGSRPSTGDNGGGTIYVIDRGYYGGFYPWGYGGLGLGSYYGGYYDPWWDDNQYPAVYGYEYEGRLRLKVKPREAGVYVDGYFAGNVDDFDGVFQRLALESGPHRIEVRLDGFEPLSFEVRIQPDRTITYSGELQRVP